ncbi:MAG: hypothetical protein H3C45_00955 [Bacteroidia bacterium]|nr:hypothetical protein [Bacteroidia bacterium]MCC7533678.1 hypothetical protein [Bacteroidia bacterium]
MIAKFSIKNLWSITANALYSLLPAGINFILSYLVINHSGNSDWGFIVSLQLYYYLISTTIAWGNKDSLLVKFSANPSQTKFLWQQSFFTRFCIACIIGLALILWQSESALHLAIWVFSRFVVQSIESIVIYEQRYKWAIVSEILPLFFVLFFINQNIVEITLQSALWIITASHCIRLVTVSIAYADWFKGINKSSFNFSLLKETFPFAIMAFIVFLQVKIDLYSFSILRPKNELGVYQVLMSFIVLAAGIPGYLLIPFSKNIYLMSIEKIKQIKILLRIVGLVLPILAVFVIRFVLLNLYSLEFSNYQFILIYIYLAIPYFYALEIYHQYKTLNEKKVLLISTIGVVTVFSVSLFTIYQWGISGALLANCIGQFVVLTLYSMKRFLFTKN